MDAAHVVEITDPEVIKICPGNRYFTSLEGENPGGSIKDKMVVGELTQLLKQGTLKQGDCVGEISAGSTAKSLAFHAPRFGLRCALFVPESLAQAEIEFMRNLGAEVHPVEIKGAFAKFDAFCAERGVHPFNQSADKSKRRFYCDIGAAAQKKIGKIETLIGAVGTGHSLLGVAEGILPKPYVVSAEPREGAVSGIRNVEKDRYGDADPCDPSLFDQRVLLSLDQYFHVGQILTSVGVVAISDSFRVVLGALSAMEREGRKNIFLLGAANRRITFKG